MFYEHTPTEDELAMAELGHLLRRNDNEPTNQEELIAKLVHAIRHFDYYYFYSDDISVWRHGEREKDWIDNKLKEVEDEVIQHHLSSHFNKDNHHKAGDILPWGKYLGRFTEYTRMRWNGKTDEQARMGVGLQDWFGRMDRKN